MEFSDLTKTRRITLLSLVGASAIVTIFLSVSLALLLAANHTVINSPSFGKDQLALPTRILDLNGEEITRFISDEDRKPVTIRQIPENMIFALMTREDKAFFKHNGISVWGTLRAVVATLQGHGVQGGSTLTQQIAGKTYCDRAEKSISRKLRELWWSFQFEREYSKYEILEHYLNKMSFGHGFYGVESTAQFFFGHSVTENTIADSVLIAIQLAKPGLYSPLRHPDEAKAMQVEVLKQVIEQGWTTEEEARISLNQYWDIDYDWQRDTSTTGFTAREDSAPYFSEFIRGELEGILLGDKNIYRDGYTVYTTLNSRFQSLARDIITEGRVQWQDRYETHLKTAVSQAKYEYMPTVNFFSMVFNIRTLNYKAQQGRDKAFNYLKENLAPTMELLSFVYNIEELNKMATATYGETKKIKERTTVEAAMVTIENKTGYILALVGGSGFTRTNQYNRALSGSMMPGSAYKPLYYSAGISSRKITAATHVRDAWEEFVNPDGTPYVPENYMGKWRGDLTVRDALRLSLNIPSVKVLRKTGFPKAIERSARLLGITDQEEIRRIFPSKYPLALGIISVSPLQLARAYATFGNNGKEVTPIGIRYITDRDGKIIMSPEEEIREYQRTNDTAIMTPQENYIMVSLLEGVVKGGTLYGSTSGGNRFSTPSGKNMPMGGKTGTTQNWADAWTCGFSPYYTTVMWIGFDQRGGSLGTDQSGAQAVGPYWTRYMVEIHKGLEPIPFEVPQSGLYRATVCRKTGQIPTKYCTDGVRSELFLTGTGPDGVCEMHRKGTIIGETIEGRFDDIMRNRNNSSSGDNTNTNNFDTGVDTDLGDLDLDDPDFELLD